MSVYVFLFVVFMILLVFTALWGWTVFLDESSPSSVRSCLYATLSIVQIIEFVIWYCDVTKPWLLIPMLLSNMWGLYDAIARFPVVHDVDSFFTLKQIILLAAKTISYPIGYRDIGRSPGWFLLALFINVWFLPLMFLMALPLGDAQFTNMRTDVVDEDLLFRIWAFRKKESREVYMRRIQRTYEDVLVSLAQIIPPLRQRLERDPRLRRRVNKKPQV